MAVDVIICTKDTLKRTDSIGKYIELRIYDISLRKLSQRLDCIHVRAVCILTVSWN